MPIPKKKIHIHSFTVERVIYRAETGNASALDMRCKKCGMAMFVNNPNVHYGDENDRPYNVNVIQYEKPAKKKIKK